MRYQFTSSIGVRCSAVIPGVGLMNIRIFATAASVEQNPHYMLFLLSSIGQPANR